MPYTAEISRTNPGCFIFLVDQSASMSDPMASGETTQPRAEVVSNAINRLLTELSVKCAKEEGVRDYFHVAVIGYGHQHVGSAYQGVLAGRDLVPLGEVANNPARVESRTKKVPDGAGGLVETSVQFPVWMDPVTNGGTPMTRALDYADKLVSNWVDAHPSGFPPIVLNLTDGESTDGDPTSAAIGLASHATADGPVLLFNLHVSGSGGAPITFPDNEEQLPDTYAKLLFQMSSVLPSHMRSYAASQGHHVSESTRGFVYNADIVSIVEFLDIGTRATELR
ncbi:VWA domain-containing protein [Streptomyces sp. WI04-05B]|uniref:vWA domain-containing protein n=1 Tax=Streptomyces TaxID=1883 RepID=UPI0029B3DEAE|nr:MULTISPECIES: VWA domain-containing protein [unclassified Streptomyces]MDX2546078.1 VWA domain-containing protein [Streptomyces sp. WI04-05B]MDX2587232.1 VWA domain-containing protein [Streptomyces sp. WI04-05A]MDX3752616.1 VWA domain-containing protein [Streptomyces sp. AK08-02]